MSFYLGISAVFWTTLMIGCLATRQKLGDTVFTVAFWFVVTGCMSFFSFYFWAKQ